VGQQDARLGDEYRYGSPSMKQLPKISAAEAVEYLRRNIRQILAVGLFLLLLHDVFGAHGFIAMRRTQKEIEQIRGQIGKLNEENKSLSSQVDSLKTDPHAIERIAREEMGLARPGERIYKLSDSDKPGDPQNPAPKQ
jgi:cell division protein FtsB